MNTYCEVAVGEAQRRLAASAARDAAMLLALPPLQVRWFREAAPDDKHATGDALLDTLGRTLGVREVGGGWVDQDRVAGLARGSEPGVIWLNADVASPFTLVHTLAHEARHRHQYQRGVLDGGWSREQAEADADAWADAFMALLAAAGRGG